jgi:hypothetical protein
MKIKFEETSMQSKHFVIGVYPDEHAAHQAVEAAIEAGCPMDRLSLLGRLLAEGDDVLGVVNPGVGARMEVWGKEGAFWGGVAGLLAGAMGVFWFPALGPIMVVGHVVSAFAGSVAGTAIGGAGLAGAAAVSQLAVALHRHGLPEAVLDDLHHAIAAGQYLVLIQSEAGDEREGYRKALAQAGAKTVMVLP